MIYGLFFEMKKKRLSENQSLIWLIGTVGLLILSIFPNILHWVAQLLGISWAPASLIFFFLIVIFFIIFHHTIAISTLENQVTELAMQVTLLKDANKELEKKLEDRHKEK